MAWGDGDKVAAPSAGGWGDKDPVVSADFAAGRAKAKSGIGGAITAGLATLNEAIPGMDEVTAGVDAAGRIIGGAKPSDAWKGARDRQLGLMSGFHEDHPVLSDLATGTGYAVQAVPALFSGGATVAPQATGAVGKTIAQRAGGLLMTGARNATTGAAYAAANAMTGRGDVQERVAAADKAIPVGAAVGVAAPVAMWGVGKAVGAGAKVVGSVAKTGLRAANAISAKTPAGAFLDPENEVITRLGEALKKDDLSPSAITAALDEWQRVGGPSPAFMDIVAKDGGGQNTMALVRGAAMSGEGRNVASKYANTVVADLQPTAIERTAQLTADQRPAEEVAASMREARSANATRDYAPAYATPVPLSEDVQSVLSDAPGQAALRQARADALERRDLSQVAEIDKLLHPTEPVQDVSAATLDRTQIAMRERADKLARAGNNARAGGAQGRRAVINTALDQVPELAPARAAYRDTSQGIEGVEKIGPGLMTASPDGYAAKVAELSATGRAGAQVGARQALTDAIGRPTEGATGVLNRISSGTNMTRNLATTFGEQPAADYQAAIGNSVEKVGNARFINPNSGSQTAGRLSDETLVESIPLSKVGLFKAIIDKFRAGATLTDAERAALVRIATGEAGSVAPRIAARIPQPRVSMTRSVPVAPALAAPMTQDQRR